MNQVIISNNVVLEGIRLRFKWYEVYNDGEATVFNFLGRIRLTIWKVDNYDNRSRQDNGGVDREQV